MGYALVTKGETARPERVQEGRETGCGGGHGRQRRAEGRERRAEGGRGEEEEEAEVRGRMKQARQSE